MFDPVDAKKGKDFADATEMLPVHLKKGEDFAESILDKDVPNEDDGPARDGICALLWEMFDPVHLKKGKDFADATLDDNIEDDGLSRDGFGEWIPSEGIP